jgi:hypothetical protein
VEQCLHIAAGTDDVENQYVLMINTVDNEILARNKTPQTGTQIVIATASDMRIAGKKEKRSAMESITRSAIPTLPLSVAM